MPDQITTAAALEYLLFGLNEDGHEPYLLVVDSRPKPALVWLREAASEEVQAGVTIGEPGLKHFTDGLSRNQTLDWLKYPVTVLYRPDAPPVIPGQNPGKPTAETVADALIRYETGGCCGFGTTCGLCDCGRSDQTAERRREWDERQLGRARAVLALIPPQRCAPSKAELSTVLIGCLGRDDYLSDTVRAITKLYSAQPTVAQVKAEAVREAVKAIRGAWDGSWNLRDPEDPETAYSVDVWLSKYADRIERGE